MESSNDAAVARRTRKKKDVPGPDKVEVHAKKKDEAQQRQRARYTMETTGTRAEHPPTRVNNRRPADPRFSRSHVEDEAKQRAEGKARRDAARARTAGRGETVPSKGDHPGSGEWRPMPMPAKPPKAAAPSKAKVTAGIIARSKAKYGKAPSKAAVAATYARYHAPKKGG